MPLHTTKTPISNRSSQKDTFSHKPGESFFDTQENTPFFTPRVQPKLLVNAPNDPYENEADTIADKVVNRSDNVAAVPPPAQTIQQGTSIQRTPDDDGEKQFRLKIPAGTKSKQEFRRYAELKIFNRVVNFNWEANAETEEVYKDISKHIGETIVFKVSEATLNRYRVEQKDTKKADEDYRKLGEDSKKDTNAEIDKRYYESTGIAPGIKINTGEQGRIDMWNDFKKQVMTQKRKLDNLPPVIKEFLHADQTFTPDNYTKLNEIAVFLDQFTAADFLDYKSKVNFETTDLEELRRSVAAYLKEKQDRRKAGDERETIKTKIYGLEDLYKKYKEFRKLEGSYKSIPARDEFGIADPNREYFRKAEDDERASLTASLKANNFNSINEFEKYINDYEAAFRKETISIAADHLQRYRHVLFEEEKRLTDDSYITKLFTEIKQSGAKQHYDTADSKRTAAILAIGTKEYVSEAQIQRQMDLNREANTEQDEGNKLMQQLPAANPLMKEEGFKKEQLARVNSKDELKGLFKTYIEDKKASIEETWADIIENPDRIYELDKLIINSRQSQGIADDGIFDLIIKDKIKDIGSGKILKAICFVVIGIALAIASFGTGVPAILAAVGSLGLSLYAVHEEIEKYKTESNAYDVGLLSEDPSLIWVVLAIVGAGLDAAAVAAAFKAAKPIAEATQAFNKANNALALEKSTAEISKADPVGNLEKALAKISGLDAKIQQHIVSAAKTELAFKQAVKNLFKSGSQLNMVLLPGAEQLGRLVVVAWYGIKRGIKTFEGFRLELELQNIIKKGYQLSTEELNMCKQAFDKANAISAEEFAKLVKRLELTDKNRKAALDIAENVRVKGKFRKSSRYHGDTVHKMPDALVQDIMANPQTIFESKNGEKLYYLKDGDIVIAEAVGSEKGQAITAYGKSGIKGDSGAKALGGLPTDPGEPVTELMVLEGKIPTKNGFYPPANKLYP
jgi:hypothetical protein